MGDRLPVDAGCLGERALPSWRDGERHRTTADEQVSAEMDSCGQVGTDGSRGTAASATKVMDDWTSHLHHFKTFEPAARWLRDCLACVRATVVQLEQMCELLSASRRPVTNLDEEVSCRDDIVPHTRTNTL